MFCVKAQLNFWQIIGLVVYCALILKKKKSTMSYTGSVCRQISWYLPAVNLELLTNDTRMIEFWKAGLRHLKLSKTKSDEAQFRSSLNISSYWTSQFHNTISPAVEVVTISISRPQWRSTACCSCRIRIQPQSPCSVQQPQCPLIPAVPVPLPSSAWGRLIHF